jgi:hypothetical protein
MKCVSCCILAVALITPQFAVASSLVPDSPLGCPPGQTLTIPPSEDAELVLAGGPQLTSEQVAGPFDSPRSVGFLPDGWFLVAEKQGRLLLVRPDGEGVPISGVPEVRTEGHGGFIDLAVDPDYAANDTIYLSYLVGTADASTIRVMKAKLDGQNGALTDQQILFESTPGAKPEQLGGRIALTPDGYLFLTLGDRWAGDPAQDLTQDEALSSAFASTARFRMTIHSAGCSARGLRSGATGTATRKALPSMRPGKSYGPTSMARKAATSSILSCLGMTMAGRPSRMAPTIRGGRSATASLNLDWSSRFTIGFQSRSLRQGSRLSRIPPIASSGSALWRPRHWSGSHSARAAPSAKTIFSSIGLEGSATCASIQAARSTC